MEEKNEEKLDIKEVSDKLEDKEPIESEMVKEEVIDEIIKDVIEVAKVEESPLHSPLHRASQLDRTSPFHRASESDRTKASQEGVQKEEIGKWAPKTKLGKIVKEGKIKNIDEILNKKIKIFEPEIVSYFLQLKTELINIGQSKGKFGGGKRRVWKQTQKKTKEGNVAKFSSMAVVGDENGHVGVGYGSAKETLPSRVKADRKAKINIMRINRGCGSFDCSCSNPHSIVSRVEGKCGSVRMILYPAPQGTGLVVGDECKKLLRLAGIKDIYGKRFGQSRTTINLIKACMDALKKTVEIR